MNGDDNNQAQLQQQDDPNNGMDSQVNDSQQPIYNDMQMDGSQGDGNNANLLNDGGDDGQNGEDDGNVDQYFDDAGDVYLPADHVSNLILTQFFYSNVY